MTGPVWLDGHLLPPHQARIDPADRGLLLGDGLFETLRASVRTPHHLARHLARLRAGADRLRIPLGWTDAQIAEAAAAVLGAVARPDSVLRLTLTRGPGARGLLPPGPVSATLLMTASPLPPTAPPARAIVVTCTRRNEHSPLARLKTLNYLDNILARQEAADRGGDEAILLNTRGDVAEGSVGNLFLLQSGDIVTPPLGDGVLPGIARALLLEAGLARECTVSAAALAATEWAFLSNSLGIRPIGSIDGRALTAPDRAVRATIEAALLTPAGTASPMPR